MVPSSLSQQASHPRTSQCCLKTILYVEDDAFVRDVTQEVLESAGYLVLSAADAVEAQRVYRKGGLSPDLLLTDVILPGESGWQLAAKLQRANPTLKALFVTGHPQQAALLRAHNEDCLAKPFSAATLLSRVEQSLGARAIQSLRTTTLGAPATECRADNVGGDIN